MTSLISKSCSCLATMDATLPSTPAFRVNQTFTSVRKLSPHAGLNPNGLTNFHRFEKNASSRRKSARLVVSNSAAGQQRKAQASESSEDKRRLWNEMPAGAPVIHSAAFLSFDFEDQDGENSAENLQGRPSLRARSMNPSAMEWALSRVDKTLEDVEKNPTPAVATAWKLARGAGAVVSDPRVQEAAAAVVQSAREVLLPAAKSMLERMRGTRAAGDTAEQS